jgi:hypothetical protein
MHVYYIYSHTYYIYMYIYVRMYTYSVCSEHVVICDTWEVIQNCLSLFARGEDYVRLK